LAHWPDFGSLWAFCNFLPHSVFFSTGVPLGPLARNNRVGLFLCFCSTLIFRKAFSRVAVPPPKGRLFSIPGALPYSPCFFFFPFLTASPIVFGSFLSSDPRGLHPPIFRFYFLFPPCPLARSNPLLTRVAVFSSFPCPDPHVTRPTPVASFFLMRSRGRFCCFSLSPPSVHTSENFRFPELFPFPFKNSNPKGPPYAVPPRLLSVFLLRACRLLEKTKVLRRASIDCF